MIVDLVAKLNKCDLVVSLVMNEEGNAHAREVEVRRMLYLL